MLYTKNIHMMQFSWKLNHYQIRSLRIINAWDKQAYKLNLLSWYRIIHSVFHVFLLKLYHEWGDHLSSSDFELVDSHSEWAVKEILAHHKWKCRIDYLVWWKEYFSADDSWESEVNLSDALNILKIYKETHDIKF